MTEQWQGGLSDEVTGRGFPDHGKEEEVRESHSVRRGMMVMWSPLRNRGSGCGTEERDRGREVEEEGKRA